MTALELYNQGRPLKSIARELGISVKSVGDKLRQDPEYSANRIGGTRLTFDQAFQAAEMDLTGYSWREISRTVGPSVNALKRAIKYYAAQESNEPLLPRGQSSLSGGKK